MRGLPALVQSLLAMVGLKNAPWAGPLIFLVLLALAMPMMEKNAGTNKARRLLRALADMPAAERPKHHDEILSIVKSNPEGLIALADEAMKSGNTDFTRKCVAQLKVLNKRAEHVRRLERALDPPGPALPEQVAIAVERLLERGLLEEAGNKLNGALARWPGHRELVALEEQLRQRTVALSTPSGAGSSHADPAPERADADPDSAQV